MEDSREIGSYITLLFGTAGMLLLATSVITFVYVYQRKLIKRKIAYQEIENLLGKQELKSAYALLEGQEMERQRIAEELHDNLGSILVTLSLYVHSLKRSTPDERPALENKIIEMADQATSETRKISHKLDSRELRHFGFEASVRDLIQAVNASNAIAIESHIDIQDEISHETSFNLYRIIQELINNTLKHARASKITIDLTQLNKECISFIYEDNGVGFSVADDHRGMGLRNIYARAEKIRAHYTFGEKSKSGFSAAFEIPLI